MRSVKERRGSPKAVDKNAAICSTSTAGTIAGTALAKERRAHGARQERAQAKVGKVQEKEKAPRRASKATAIIAESGGTVARIAGAHPQEETEKEKARKVRKAKPAEEKDTRAGGTGIATRTTPLRPW